MCVSLCVRLMSWHLCEMLQLSTLPGIRNQTQSHLTSCERWSVTQNSHTRTHEQKTCVSTSPIGTEQQDTHSSPRPAREEGSKGWWSHATPTAKPACHTQQVAIAFHQCNLQNRKTRHSEICGELVCLYLFLFFLKLHMNRFYSSTMTKCSQRQCLRNVDT